MRDERRCLLTVTMIASVVAGTIAAQAQTVNFLSGNADIGQIVRDAPFSAEGLTTLTLTLGDGTRIERRLPIKLYRDSLGRIRREQTIVGLAALNPASESLEVVVMVDPVEGFTYTLSPSSRTARRALIGNMRSSEKPPPPPPPPPPGAVTSASAPPPPLPSPLRPAETSLGTRDIEGLTAIGTRRTLTVPVGAIGNDRAIEIIDERWVSRDLHVLLSSRYQDPRTGVVTFQLTNVRRGEPASSLFGVPAGYTVINTPALRPPASR
jgi:hypothetical protein